MQNTDTFLPDDQNNNPIQTLGADDATVVSVSLGGTASAATSMPVSYPGIIEISLSEDAYVAFGGGSVQATTSSRLLNKGTYVYSLLDGQSHFSVLRLSTSGVCTVTELR